MKKEIKNNKCKVSPQYGKDNNKNLHFYCENCGEEMEYDEDRICEAKQPKEIKEKIIKAWAVCAKTRNGKDIIQQNFIDESFDVLNKDEDRMYCVYVICDGVNSAKRYNRIELDNDWEVKPVEIKILK